MPLLELLVSFSRRSLIAAAVPGAVLWCGGAVRAAEQEAPAPAQAFSPPVNDVPKWYTIKVPENATSGTQILVRSLNTGRPLGSIEVGAKILAFGSDSSIVTFAYRGHVGFIPASAATESWPAPAGKTEWRAPGKTLEQQREEAKTKAKEGRNGTLEPKSLREQEQKKNMPGGGAPQLPAGRYGGDKGGAGAAI